MSKKVRRPFEIGDKFKVLAGQSSAGGCEWISAQTGDIIELESITPNSLRFLCLNTTRSIGYQPQTIHIDKLNATVRRVSRNCKVTPIPPRED